MAKTADLHPTKQSDEFITVFGNTIKLISESWTALRLNLVTFIIVYVLPLLLFGASAYMAVETFLVKDGNTYKLAENISSDSVIAASIAGVGLLVILLISSIASTIAQLASVRGKTISASEAINQSFPYIVRFIGLAFLSALAVLLGFVALIIPGFIVMFFIFFAGYILIDKDTTPILALKECVKLTKNNWKLALSFVLLLIGIQMISNITFIGQIAGEILSLVYLCLPAILYVRMQKQNPVVTSNKK